MSLDDQDLRVRLTQAENRLRLLQHDYDELQSRAFALLWHLPAQLKVAELQAERGRMWDIIKRANRTSEELTALNKRAAAWDRAIAQLRQIGADLDTAAGSHHVAGSPGNGFGDASTLPQSVVTPIRHDLVGPQPPAESVHEDGRTPAPSHSVVLTPPIPEQPDDRPAEA